MEHISSPMEKHLATLRTRPNPAATVVGSVSLEESMATYKALLVGAGGMGRQWGKNLKACDETDLAGWIDLRAGAAEKAAAKLELSIFTGTDLRDGIAATKPDFVVDVTTPESHHDVTLIALAAGVPVLGEKPMADTMERARAMVAASEQAKKLYMVSQSRRY